MDLQLLFRALWKKRWVLIVVPLISIVCAFLIQLFGEWKFKSTAQLGTGITINDELIDKGTRFNAYEIQVTFTNLMEMIKSRAVLSQVSYRLMYHDLAGIEKPFREPPKSRFEEELDFDLDQAKIKFAQILKEKSDSLAVLDPTNIDERNLEKVIEVYGYDHETLLAELDVARVNISDYIELDFLSENKNLSAFVVNSICNEFIRYYSNMKMSRSNISLESLTSIVEQRKKYFDEKVEELKNFRSSNELVNPGLESESKMQQIQQYENEIAAEQQRMRGLELSLASLNIRLKEAKDAVSNQPNEKIISIRKRINTLNEQYITGGQTDAALLDSITRLRGQLQSALNRVNESTKLTPVEMNALKDRRDQAQIDLEISRENLNSLNKVLASIRFSIGNFANKEAVSQALDKEVEVARTEYLAAQTRYNEASEKLVTNKISIAQAVIGQPAERPESRKTIIFMIFSGILSFAISAFVIILLELADSKIRNPQRFKRFTKLALSGVIPQLSKSNLGWSFFTKENGHARDLNNLNQNLRKIRYDIESRKAQVLLVTSTQRTQGKTFFVMSLAYSLSLIHKKILIIDTNLRNNTLTKMMTAQGNLRLLIEHHNQMTKQITDGTDQKVDGDKSYYSGNLISRTTNELVDIIGSRLSQSSPSEIIPGGDFKVLMEWLKVKYDYIILEGAGLNEYSDSRELVRFVDLVIPVFSAETTINDEDKESLAFLRSLQQKLGAGVLNNFQSEEKKKYQSEEKKK